MDLHRLIKYRCAVHIIYIDVSVFNAFILFDHIVLCKVHENLILLLLLNLWSENKIVKSFYVKSPSLKLIC